MSEVTDREAVLRSIKRLAMAAEEATDWDQAMAETKLERLESEWDKFQVAHEKVLKLTESSDKKAVLLQEEVLNEAEDLYDQIKAKLRRIKQPVLPQASGESESGGIKIGIRLPKIELPKFNGNFQHWMSFKDMYVQMVHSSEALSNVEKFYYLRGHLEGEPAQLIRAYEMTESNYTAAWQQLKDRYDNKRSIVNVHLRKLFSQAQITSEDQKALRKLIDNTMECVRSLKALDIPTGHWDAILIYLVTSKLDPESVRLWEQSIDAHRKELPSFDELIKFLDGRCRSLLAIGSCGKLVSKQSGAKPKTTLVSTVKPAEEKCVVCNEKHTISYCLVFSKLDVVQRRAKVHELGLCFNCLKRGHNANECKGRKCYICHFRHHPLIHIHQKQTEETEPKASTSGVNIKTTANKTEVKSAKKDDSEKTVSNNFASDQSDKVQLQVLLSTAWVNIATPAGKMEPARVLLDSGSQASFITQECAQRLGLRWQPSKIQINTLGKESCNYTKGMLEVQISSCQEKAFNATVRAYVLSKITGYHPTPSVTMGAWQHLEGLNLADPEFHKSGPIDMLFGADIYGELLQNEVRKGEANSPIAQKTVLGWILLGRVSTPAITCNLVVSFEKQRDTENALKRFWEIEECQTKICLTAEEMECESHFEKTHRRTEEGRYVVNLPFKKDRKPLGESRNTALKRLQQTERRFAKDKQLKVEYEKFMTDYEILQHMKLAEVPAQGEGFILPHHAVKKPESTTTKVRVVFDGSSKTSSGESLNDQLLVGPKLQNDLYDIVLRFRKYAVVMTADIAKMFRQVWVDESQTDFQRILWRESDSGEIKEYKLTTVTYGTASATYLATKVVQQLAKDCQAEYPEIYNTIINDFYVDDLLTGCDDEQTALKAQKMLIDVLKSGGFELRKWSSNRNAITQAVPETFRECLASLEIQSDDTVKTLGIYWSPGTDIFSFKINLSDTPEQITKRIILSEVSKLYDPEGWLAPIILIGKLFIQRLWVGGFEWDQRLPAHIQQQWRNYREELPWVQFISIPRWIGFKNQHELQLHGFSDASESAYAAAVYTRVTSLDGQLTVTLLTAKTKVAPTKQITLPRLELCGALLLANLIARVKSTIGVEINSCYTWTDSKVVLAWLRKPPMTWKTFVANRVAEIQEKTEPANWKYVPTNQNPADIASRGQGPMFLRTNDLWWKGPNWLSKEPEHWPTETQSNYNTELESKPTVAVLTVEISEVWELLNRYSKFKKLKGVTACAMRFVHNLRVKIGKQGQRKSGPITPEELNEAEIFWVKEVQKASFPTELNCCLNSTELPQTSKLISLHPFCDESGVLRVGGRLAAAELDFEQKHQVILPKDSFLTELIISEIHDETKHGGIKLMLYTSRSKWWIVSAKARIRQYVNSCIPCFRQRKKLGKQFMAELPSDRVNPTRPFLVSGVDFAGPISLCEYRGRGKTTHKGYVAVFVCFSTKAIHLELVTDLSTNAFLAAFRRFVARRGKCAKLYSDNATNFVGARNLMAEYRDHIESLPGDWYLASTLAEDGTEWTMIPPSAPHFGGLWEAAVKSFKRHFITTIGTARLTYEETNTLLAQIEAVLNSRPLCEMVDEVGGPNILTPGHFLIGEALIAVPEPNITEMKINPVDRWRFIQKLYQTLWKKWSQEYMTELQRRTKWLRAYPNFEVNDLVLVKDEMAPPTKWPLARVTETHPGADGKVRVVTLKIGNNSVKRPIHKLCLLPVNGAE